MVKLRHELGLKKSKVNRKTDFVETHELVVSSASGYAADLDGFALLVGQVAQQDGLVDDAGVVILKHDIMILHTLKYEITLKYDTGLNCDIPLKYKLLCIEI
jgi:hypothetical protein